MGRSITVDDFVNIQMVSDPRVSPDGKRVAFVKRHIDAEKNKYRSEIWVADLDGGLEPRKFTSSETSAGSPRWSPDGKQIAFVSDRQKPKSQIFSIPANGGEAAAISKFETEGSIQGISWSPDGSTIACLYRLTPAEFTKEATEERKTKELPAPVRVHKALNYRHDGGGFVDGAFWQVAVVNTSSGEDKILTNGDFDCDAPIWSPDGNTLALDRKSVV